LPLQTGSRARRLAGAAISTRPTTVIGIPDSRTEIVMLRPPDGRTSLELPSFVRPDHQPRSPTAMANGLGLRNIAFDVDDL